MINILLIEDNRLISDNIKTYMEPEFSVTQCFDGAEAYDFLAANIYDIIVLDVMLPNIEGMTILRHIVKEYPCLSVIMLTAKEDISDKINAFTIGVNDYLTKPFYMEELKARINCILRTKGIINKDNSLYFKNLVLDLNMDQAFYIDGDEKINLYLNEKLFSLLEYFVLNKNKLLFKEQIFNRICGFDSEATTQIVEVYVSRLRKALAEFGYDKYLITARGRGYIIDENV